MAYKDKPKPSICYLAVVWLPTFLGLAALFWEFRDGAEPIAGVVIFAGLLAVTTFFSMKAARRAYDVEYRLEDGGLVLREGKREKEVPLQQLKSVEPVMLAVSFFGAGEFVNRVFDGVRIEAGGESYLLTPANPRLFVSMMRGLVTVPVETGRPGAGG